MTSESGRDILGDPFPILLSCDPIRRTDGEQTGSDWTLVGARQSYIKNGAENHLTDMAKANDPDPPLGLHRSEFFGFDNWK